MAPKVSLKAPFAGAFHVDSFFAVLVDVLLESWPGLELSRSSS